MVQSMDVSPATARPVTWVWPAALALGVLDLAAGLGPRGWWLNPAAERSPFSWAAALAVVVAAACVAVLATRSRGKTRMLLAGGLVLVAADEALGLHERLAADLDVRSLAKLEWCTVALLGYTLLLGAVAVLLLLEARSSRRPPTLLLAGVVLLAAALGARFGGAALAALDELPAGETRDAGEAVANALGLTGWVLVATGLLVVARRAPA